MVFYLDPIVRSRLSGRIRTYTKLSSGINDRMDIDEFVLGLRPVLSSGELKWPCR
jgi:hypothetical protein